MNCKGHDVVTLGSSKHKVGRGEIFVKTPRSCQECREPRGTYSNACIVLCTYVYVFTYAHEECSYSKNTKWSSSRCELRARRNCSNLNSFDQNRFKDLLLDFFVWSFCQKEMFIVSSSLSQSVRFTKFQWALCLENNAEIFCIFRTFCSIVKVKLFNGKRCRYQK